MRYYGKVEISGVNTNKLVVLTGAQKKELIEKIKQGDTFAREKFINGNIKLVLSVIQRFVNRGENLDDLFQVGCMGLIKATDNFDTSHNVQFSTYAVPMIIGEIRRYLRDNSAIRVSRSMRDTAYSALQTKEKLINETQKEPTIEEIAKAMNLPKEEIVMALDSISDPISLYEPVYNDGEDAIYIMDQIKDQTNVDDNWIDEISLREAIQQLDIREKNILNLRFFEGRTQMEVAQEIGISQAQVSRLEKSVINEIKKHI